MRTRIIAVVVAAVLAIAGAGALVVALQSSAQSAAAGVRTVPVLVVTDAIPTGTHGEQATARIAERDIPAAYVAEGVATDPAQLAGLVALVDLQPGEQVLASRWGAPAALTATGTRIPAPDGTQEISLALGLERVAGGAIAPGSVVGVWSSRDGATSLLYDGVLVTALASTASPADEGTRTDGTALVTFAVTADQAQGIIQAAEFGKVWLTLQGSR